VPQLQDPPAGLERDPRTAEAWFQQLPPAEQARLEERWQRRTQAAAEHVERDRRLLLRTIAECAAILTIVLLLALSWRQLCTWRNLLVVPGAAAATGFLIHNWFREQFQVSLLGPLVAFALAYQAAASGLQLVFVLVAACVAFGCYGVRRHFRALDGMQ
jgi:hypothetical protein